MKSNVKGTKWVELFSICVGTCFLIWFFISICYWMYGQLNPSPELIQKRKELLQKQIKQEEEHQKLECSYASTIFEGTHELKKFSTYYSNEGKWSGSYFLCMGVVSGYSTTTTKVKCAWKLNTGEFVFSEIPITKIRIIIDSTISNPYIKFKWKSSDMKNMDYLINNEMIYIVVYCRAEDFPTEIKIN